MIFELNKEYKISRSKQVLYRVFAIILLIGAIVSIPTSILLRSVSPLLGGIYLGFAAYIIYNMASQTMMINIDGILLKSFSGEGLLPWENFGEITQGKGINMHKVSYTLLSNPPSPGINLGLCRLKLSEDYHLPNTFGMDAKKLAADLEQTRKENIQQEGL
jgi:hypothetical protein